MIKSAPKVISKYFKILFDRIYNEGKIPREWNKAKIIPIPKKKDNELNIRDFRPISLLSIPGKLLESIITDRLTEIVIKNN